MSSEELSTIEDQVTDQTGGGSRDITDASILRIAHKAGIKALSSQIYPEVIVIANKLIDNIIQRASLNTGKALRTVISINDITQSLEELKITIPENANDQTSDQSKMSISKAGFRRTCVKYLPTRMRWSVNANSLLQISIEAYFVNLFEDVNQCCLHTGRLTVVSKDLQLARRIRRET